ncbi:uncharacterized protein F54H12.2-like [Crassostrea virginica]
MAFLSELNTSMTQTSELDLFSDAPNQAKITKADGTALTSSEKTGIINLPLQAMFSQIDVYFNGKLMSQNANNYPWKAYLKVLLSSGVDCIDTQLQTELYFPDQDSTNDPDAKTGGNEGFRKRYVFTQLSRTFDLEGPLYLDCFYLDKYLINGVDIQLRMFRSRNEFVIMSKEDSTSYKINILDAVFKACKVKVDSAVLLNHANIITKTPARYNYLKTDVKMTTIADKTSEFYWDDVWNDKRPSRMYVTFVNQAGVNGSYKENPFNFQHFNMSDIASERWYKDSSLIIDRFKYSKGYAIFAFELDPSDLGGGEYINLVNQGNVGVYARFAQPTTDTISAIAYCDSPGLLLVDQAREI